MMKKHFYFTRLYIQQIKRFYHDERGVYAVITALLMFPLLVVIGFAVDGSGILLDKARLAQATSQAALSLVAENNNYRERSHDDVERQSFTSEQLKKFKGSKDSVLSAKQDSRNLELVHGIARAYLYSETNNGQTDLPVTITDDFHYKCEEIDLQGPQRYQVRKPVVCEVQGKVNRQFWLPWSADSIESGLKAGKRLPIDSGLTYAIKQKGITIPVELMLVSDFSGSMLEQVNGKKGGPYNSSKIAILRSVVKDVQDILLPEKESADVSPYNRMAFATFAGGAKQLGDKGDRCVLPYFGNSSRPDLDSKIKAVLRNRQWPEESVFDRYLDADRTVAEIRKFNGEKRNYELKIRKEGSCLDGNLDVPTTNGWFDQNNKDVSGALGKVKPMGWTAATAGMIIGANVMMKKNTNPKTEPKTLGTNTQRVMLVLSDGDDNKPTAQTLVRLMDRGLCNAIRQQVDTLQDKDLTQLPTRIGFVAFGFNPPQDQIKAWKQCVGEHYYYADNKETLLESFKQILSFEEEVGTSSSKKPELK